MSIYFSPYWIYRIGQHLDIIGSVYVIIDIISSSWLMGIPGMIKCGYRITARGFPV